MRNYETAYGHLPPAVVYGKNGQPLYSWRVLILPYIEYDELYRQFKLDEPWDSPHNIQLLENMPVQYRAPRSKRSKLPKFHTICHVFVGPGAAFEGKQGLTFKDFGDGSTNTLMIVEAGDPVPWSKPEDIEFDPNKPVPELYCVFQDGFRGAMCDGSVHWFDKNIDRGKLRALITRNGGEQVNLFEEQ